MEQPEQPKLSPFIVDGPPWEKKHDLGFFVAFIETIKAFLFHPANTFSVMRRVASISDALVYTVALQVFAFLWTFALNGADPALLLPQDEALLEILQLPDNFSQVMVLIYPLSVILLQFLSALAFHLALRWRNLQTYDFSMIFRILAYGSGTASLLLILPVFGGLISIGMTVYIVYTGFRTIYGFELDSFIVTVLLFIVISIALYLAFAIGLSILILFFSLLI